MKPYMQYDIKTVEVMGGYDLIISNDLQQAILYIHDKSQANELGQRIIDIAIERKIDINAAMVIFNQGSGMFNIDENHLL